MNKKTYAVTGVATGIGAELVKLLKAAGHIVVGFDIKNTNNNVDHFISLDLNDEQAIDDAVDNLDFDIDGLCNNAGVPPRDGLEETVLQVNFIGTRQFTQRVLPKINSNGAIVNMASRAGHQWRDNLEQVKRFAALRNKDQLAAFVKTESVDATRCYNLSKEALLLWTVSETEKLISKQLRMNSVSPAAVSTTILDDFKKAFGDRVNKNVARVGRPAEPKEVAQLAAFLLSD